MDIYKYQDQSSSERQETAYMRTYMRNIPSQPLQPYLDSRPVMTKYSILPIVDPRKETKTPLTQQKTFHPSSNFNPGNDSGPWSGYASSVNDESELRNQIYAHQSCPQAHYIPSSKSSLYNVAWNNNNSKNVNQPFPTLFEQSRFPPNNPNAHPDIIGYALFNNATRQQLKDVPSNTNC